MTRESRQGGRSTSAAPAGASPRDVLHHGSDRWSTEVQERLDGVTLTARPRSHEMTSIARCDLDDVLVSDWVSSGFRGRTTARDAGRPATLLALVVTAGVQTVGQDGDAIDLRPGAVLLSTGGTEDPVYASRDVRMISTKVPLSALPGFSGALPPRRSVVAVKTSPLARLLVANLRGLAATHAGLSRAEQCVARSIVLQLLSGLAAGAIADAPGASDRERLRRDADRFILAQLAAGCVPDVDDVARAVFSSRRSVQRAYAVSGTTVSGVIRGLRVQAVREDLERTSLPLSTIADRWGYFDASHLTRELKTATGRTPGSFRRETQSYNGSSSASKSRAVAAG